MTDTASPRSFSVVIGDASEQVRSAIAGLIHDHPGLQLAATASDGDQAAQLCATHQPNLAVVDLMKHSQHRHAHEAIRMASPETVVAVFTARADRRTRERVLASGVHAVYQKGSVENLGDSLHALVEAINPGLAT